MDKGTLINNDVSSRTFARKNNSPNGHNIGRQNVCRAKSGHNVGRIISGHNVGHGTSSSPHHMKSAGLNLEALQKKVPHSKYKNGHENSQIGSQNTNPGAI